MKFIVILTLVCVLIQTDINAAKAKKKNRKCRYMGTKYKPGDTFGERYDSETNTCFIFVCNSDGSKTTLETPNCYTTTPETSTTPRGCFHNGRHYNYGDNISSGHSDNWCFGSFCDKSGHVIEWDNFNCGTSTTSPPSTTSQPKTTSLPYTTTGGNGCFYKGMLYPPGKEISKGEDKDSNWCYSVICSDSGEILYWDNFECFPTTTPTVTMETTPITTPPPTTASARKRLVSKLSELLKKDILY